MQLDGPVGLLLFTKSDYFWG